MAIAGIRDISVINSPPTDRLPIQTYVGGYDPEIVRRAITQEVDRGVRCSLYITAFRLLEPWRATCKILCRSQGGYCARADAGKALEEVMRRFTSGEVDVLLSTSIIESGLDIRMPIPSS
jgi:transcription-repair coupling factor (superfamily II helicase)